MHRIVSFCSNIIHRLSFSIHSRLTFLIHHPYILRDPLFLGPRAVVALTFALLLFFLNSFIRPEYHDASAEEIDYNLPSLGISIMTDTSSWGDTGDLVIDATDPGVISGTITTAVTSKYVGYKLFVHFNTSDFISEDTLSTIPAITTPASTLASGHWGYRIGGTGNYLVPMVTEATKSLIASDATPHPTPVQHSIGVYVDTTGVDAKVYENIAHFTVEPYPSQYSLTYYENKPTGVTATISGIPTSFTGDIATLGSPYAHTLSTSTPTLEGHTFCGWGKRATATCDSADIITTLTLDSSHPSANVYAVWREVAGEPTDLEELSALGGTMQEITPEICANTPIADTAGHYQYQLKDARDNKLYYVAHLADDNCWMTQNLDYDIKAEGNEVAVIGGTTATWSPGVETMTTLSIPDDNSIGKNSVDEGNYYIVGGGSSNACETWKPTSACENTKSTVSLTSAEAKSNVNLHYHIGNYYQWSAATAGTADDLRDGEATTSICPKGWRLPSGSTSSATDFSYARLSAIYNNPENDAYYRNSPLYFVRGGNIYRTAIQLQGREAEYWTSSTPTDLSNAYSFQFSSDRASIYDNTSRANGLTVRCVAEQPEPDYLSMQDVADWRDTLGMEESIQAVDERDGKLYWVTKLKDGNIWMTQNLDYDLSNESLRTLTPDTSDVSTETTLSVQIYHAAQTVFDPEQPYYKDGGDVYYTLDSYDPGISTSGLAPDALEWHRHAGSYYSWAAATAGYSSSQQYDSAPNSICPKGWRLPTAYKSASDFTGEIKVLHNIYLTEAGALFNAPVYFGNAGRIDYTGTRNNYADGFYWSSTNNNQQYAYAEYTNTPMGNLQKSDGLSIRCITDGPTTEEPEPEPTNLEELAAADGTMQDITPEICAATPAADTAGNYQYQLRDARDNKLYWVAHLADGNCWMTQNLDFAIPTTGVELKTIDSDVKSDKVLTATNGWEFEDISFYEGGDYYKPNGIDPAVEIDCSVSDNANCHYHIGNYYNWTAATAGSGTSSVKYGTATESICPKGWKLPYGNSFNDFSFGRLTNSYGITNYTYTAKSDAKLLLSPLWFVRAGSVSSGVLDIGSSDDDWGGYGFLWSSTAYDTANAAYRMYFTSVSVDITFSYYNRDGGHNIRCVHD